MASAAQASLHALTEFAHAYGGAYAYVWLYVTGVLTTILGLLLILIIRTVLFVPARKPLPPPSDPLGPLFQKRADTIARRLAHALTLKTVSYDFPQGSGAHARKAPCAAFHDHGNAKETAPAARRGRSKSPARKPKADPAAVADAVTHTHTDAAHDPFAVERAVSRKALKDMHAFLAREYPKMHSTLQREVVNEYSLVFVWRGADPSLQATALYAHMDVVPADDAHLWKVDPFAGEIKDGFVWGRGAIDDKQAVIGICEAIEHLVATGFKPRRTVVVMFGHDEEIGGAEGAQFCAKWVEENVIVKDAHTGERKRPLAVLLDEGLFVLDGAVPGHADRTALICTAEKGFVNVELSVAVTGGHASSPPDESAIGILSSALSKLEKHPFPARFEGGPVVRMFQTLLPGLTFPMRVIMSNLWLTRPLVAWILTRSPKSATLVRTTTALTIFKAGIKANTLPTEARAVVNHRIHPLESVDYVMNRDTAVISDSRVKMRAIDPVEPSPMSDDRTQAFRILAKSVEGLYLRTVAAPALMVGATDSHWSAHIADNMYRHCPTELSVHETSMFHGVDERISVENLARICAFYTRVISEWDAAHL